MTSLRAACTGLALLTSTAASAQTISAAPAASAAKPTTVSASAAPGKTAVLPANCMRLPLSDVAFGTENATATARVKQQEYAEAEAKKRKWVLSKPMVKSNETVSCTVYLDLGPLGTEYRCLVTTTFCQK